MVDTITGTEALPPDPPDLNSFANSDDVSNSDSIATSVNQTHPNDATNRGNSKNASQEKSRTRRNMHHFVPTTYLRYLELDFGDKDRRTIDPYAVRNEIERKTGEKLREISGSNKHKLTLQTRSNSQTEKCQKIDTLQGYKCVIRPHPRFNTSKGLIYLRQYNIQDLQEFKENLQEQYEINCVERADFIGSRQPGVSPSGASFQIFLGGGGAIAPPPKKKMTPLGGGRCGWVCISLLGKINPKNIA